jgi:hypothetical protein
MSKLPVEEETVAILADANSKLPSRDIVSEPGAQGICLPDD